MSSGLKKDKLTIIYGPMYIYLGECPPHTDTIPNIFVIKINANITC